MTILNCIATGSHAKVLKYNVTDKKDPLYKVYKDYHVGLDLEANEVYSIFPGQISYVGRDNTGWSVIIMYNAANYIMYKHLKDVIVSKGEHVDIRQMVGHANKFVHVDYLSVDANMWPVRIANHTFYKHDPTHILTTGYQSLISYYADVLDGTEQVYVYDDELTPEESFELSHNRGKNE